MLFDINSPKKTKFFKISNLDVNICKLTDKEFFFQFKIELEQFQSYKKIFLMLLTL